MDLLLKLTWQDFKGECKNVIYENRASDSKYYNYKWNEKGNSDYCPKVDKITPRKLPNCIGAADENYGAKWIVSQEQKDKIREFWEQVPQALKDAIKQLH